MGYKTVWVKFKLTNNIENLLSGFISSDRAYSEPYNMAAVQCHEGSYDEGAQSQVT